MYRYILVFVIVNQSFAQLKTGTEAVKWITWSILQAVPSPVYYEDTDNINTTSRFGLSWNVIPFSYSFNTNKYVSPLSFFHINPVKRFSGSVEIFYEPTYITGNFKYSGLKRFLWKSGGRVILPLAQSGEYLSFSAGIGYYRHNTLSSEPDQGLTYECSLYSFFGMLGLKFNYYQKGQSRYSFGLYFKYY